METTSTSTSVLDNLRWKKEEYKVADGDNGMLTQEDFFALLTQELAHQDPTKPVENNEMISQMTAFSTTDGVATLNDKFEEFASGMSSSQALQASSLVGRSVLVEDNSFMLAESDVVAKGKLETDEHASNVKIYVQNAAGQVVQTVDVGSVQKGEFGFEWDGMDSSGNRVPPGVYSFNVAGLVDGQASTLASMTYRKVDSVTLAGAGGSVVLNLNGGNAMKLSDVVEVAEG